MTKGWVGDEKKEMAIIKLMVFCYEQKEKLSFLAKTGEFSTGENGEF